MARTALPAVTRAALDRLAEATRDLDEAMTAGRPGVSDLVKAYRAAQDEARKTGATEEEIASVKDNAIS